MITKEIISNNIKLLTKHSKKYIKNKPMSVIPYTLIFMFTVNLTAGYDFKFSDLSSAEKKAYHKFKLESNCKFLADTKPLKIVKDVLKECTEDNVVYWLDDYTNRKRETKVPNEHGVSTFRSRCDKNVTTFIANFQYPESNQTVEGVLYTSKMEFFSNVQGSINKKLCHWKKRSPQKFIFYNETNKKYENIYLLFDSLTEVKLKNNPKKDINKLIK